MQFIDLTLPSPEENLALDEAILDHCDQKGHQEVLRFWEPDRYFVVLGYGCQLETDVNISACQQDGIPVFRRISGGGTVLQGPGCLNFSLITTIQPDQFSRNITKTNAWIMQKHQAVFQVLLKKEIHIQGITDLTVESRKFSGNAQRRRRFVTLFHGSFLINFEIGQVSKYLLIPTRQPAYRQNRSHDNFLTNISLSAPTIKESLREAWSANQPFTPLSRSIITRLAREKYSKNELDIGN